MSKTTVAPGDPGDDDKKLQEQLEKERRAAGERDQKNLQEQLKRDRDRNAPMSGPVPPTPQRKAQPQAQDASRERANAARRSDGGRERADVPVARESSKDLWDNARIKEQGRRNGQVTSERAARENTQREQRHDTALRNFANANGKRIEDAQPGRISGRVAYMQDRGDRQVMLVDNGKSFTRMDLDRQQAAKFARGQQIDGNMTQRPGQGVELRLSQSNGHSRGVSQTPQHQRHR